VPPTNAKVGGGPWTHISKTIKIKTALLNILFAYTIIVFVRLLHNTKKHMVDPRIDGCEGRVALYVCTVIQQPGF
jgi:hypothetical protein